jgi:hypothetical protein
MSEIRFDRAVEVTDSNPADLYHRKAAMRWAAKHPTERAADIASANSPVGVEATSQPAMPANGSIKFNRIVSGSTEPVSPFDDYGTWDQKMAMPSTR